MLPRLCVLTLCGLVLAAAPASAAEPSDISTVKDKLKAFTDGKGRYVVLEPFGDDSYAHFYYSGDGKTFWLQRVIGGSRSGDESFDRSFWDPRSVHTCSFGFRNQVYALECDRRKTELKPLADADHARLLEKGKFMKVRWLRQAYALARDNVGTYYYVDRMREPEGNKHFRLYVGLKGAMKLQKMTNVVSDSAGDIFATKTGELRLVMNKSETFWMKGKAQVKLIYLPLSDNHVLIYNELGVYTGEKLGTPCDDL